MTAGTLRPVSDLMLAVSGLSKSYARRDGTSVLAVDGIDFQIASGEILSLLGPNGAGKTTTISMISGLLEPTSGDALIGGISITKAPLEAKKLIGVVPQEIAVYEDLSARQNLSFFGRMQGMSGTDLAKRIEEVLEFVGLTDRQRDKVKTFSGGMKRRLNVGVGLLHRPRLVFMDEPTVGIDPQSRRRILDTVKQLRDQMGMAVLYTTHLMEEAQELSDRIGIIDHGSLVAMGTHRELIERVGAEDRLVLEVGSPPDSEVIKKLAATRGVGDVSVDGVTITVLAQEGRRLLAGVLQKATAGGLDVRSVQVKEPDLEAVFLEMTGHQLRD